MKHVIIAAMLSSAPVPGPEPDLGQPHPFIPDSAIKAYYDRPPFKNRHPRIYMLTAPVRYPWRACVWIGKKAEPIQPFLNLCGSCGQIASPFVFGTVHH